MDRDEGGAAPLSASAEAVLAAIQRSVDAVQEFLETTGRQAAVISSLEGELTRGREQVVFLEKETARLRAELTARNQPRSDEIEALIEEQNVLAHMFVSSDRLARARSPREALDIGVEVLHNLAGVHRYAVWLRTAPGAAAKLVAPAEARFRSTEPAGALVGRAFESTAPVRAQGAEAGGLPVAVPLLLDGAAVGVVEIRELVPQVGRNLGRLQEDLLQFLADRLAPAMGQAGLSSSHALAPVWAGIVDALPSVADAEERRP